MFLHCPIPFPRPPPPAAGLVAGKQRGYRLNAPGSGSDGGPTSLSPEEAKQLERIIEEDKQVSSILRRAQEEHNRAMAAKDRAALIAAEVASLAAAKEVLERREREEAALAARERGDAQDLMTAANRLLEDAREKERLAKLDNKNAASSSKEFEQKLKLEDQLLQEAARLEEAAVKEEARALAQARAILAERDLQLLQQAQKAEVALQEAQRSAEKARQQLLSADAQRKNNSGLLYRLQDWWGGRQGHLELDPKASVTAVAEAEGRARPDPAAPGGVWREGTGTVRLLETNQPVKGGRERAELQVSGENERGSSKFRMAESGRSLRVDSGRNGTD